MSNPWESDAFARINLPRLDRHVAGTPAEVDFILSETMIPPRASVLDVACGAGRHSLELARRGFDVVGIDVAPLFVDTARRRAQSEGLRAEFAVCDAVHMDYDARFDMALCMWSSAIGETEDEGEDVAIVRNVHRALRTGGWFVVSTPNGARMYSKQSEALDLAAGTAVWRAADAHDEAEISHIENTMRLYVPSEFSLLLRLSGFEVHAVYGASVGDLSARPVTYEDMEFLVLATKR